MLEGWNEPVKLKELIAMLEELTNTSDKHRRWEIIRNYRQLTGRTVGEAIDL